ncbi:SusF/SusE family outer membrane protein [Chryseobacterium gleum]|uniref:SusF/SusE family outer membrane protein n=1 Tax=Chryseobacterium gleum TaxID=250 RepID=UPI0028B0618D|nr:SusF/SusE family outer membrane protein [Chryseobacterium gleum]
MEDLFKFNEALKNYTILKKETTDKAFTPYLNDHYGLGFQISDVSGKKTVGHDGGGPGYRTRYYRVLEDDICLIVISNSELSHTDFIIPKIEKILYDQSYSVPTSAKIGLKDLKKLEGTYSAGNSNFYISVVDGQIIFREDGYPRCSLLPVSNTSFQLDEKFSFTLSPAQAGKPETAVIHFRDGTVKEVKKNSNTPSWGIIGNAIPNGWDGKDIPLQADPQNPDIHFLKNYKLAKGNFKFRFNNDWAYNFGLNNDGKSIALDAYDFPISEDGAYDIVLDMTDTVQPKYTIRKSNL